MLKARILSSGPNVPLTLPPEVENRLREQRKRSGEYSAGAASACESAFYDSRYLDGGAACVAGGGYVLLMPCMFICLTVYNLYMGSRQEIK